MSKNMDQLGDKFVIAELERQISERDKTIEELKLALQELSAQCQPLTKKGFATHRKAKELLERLGY